MRERVAATFLAIALPLQTGCVNTLPPPPPPATSIPATTVAEPDGSSGMARVLFTADLPARVESLSHGRTGQSHGRPTYGTLRQILCEVTPCTVTLPYGDHDVQFAAIDTDAGRASTVVVHVTQPTVVVNHVLGRHETGSGAVIGGLAILTGLILSGVALGAAIGGYGGTAKNFGIATAAALGGGVLVWALFPSTVQDGATNQWSPAPQGKVVGGSLGFRF